MPHLLTHVRSLGPWPRSDGWRPTLRQRRRARTVRHAVIALLVGLCVFILLQGVSSQTATHTVVVAAHTLTRGKAIERQDVLIRTVPDSAVWDHAPASADEVVKLLPLLDIRAGEPILASMLATTPLLPEGFTAIDVRLASVPGSISVGMTVSLVTTAVHGCPDGISPERDSCVLSPSAIVMESHHSDALTDSTSQVFAMPPDDALNVISAQKTADIMAVSRAD